MGETKTGGPTAAAGVVLSWVVGEHCCDRDCYALKLRVPIGTAPIIKLLRWHYIDVERP